MQMNFNIWATRGQAFCWLNENEVIVVSLDNKAEEGHCELLNMVSLIFNELILTLL